MCVFVAQFDAQLQTGQGKIRPTTYNQRVNCEWCNVHKHFADNKQEFMRTSGVDVSKELPAKT